MKAEPGMMHNGDASQMGQMKPGRMKDHGMMGDGMMGGGMMGGGMMGMMGSCPMMGAAGGANSKVMMQMPGEMMRAMGDIMIKYADTLEMPSSPQYRDLRSNQRAITKTISRALEGLQTFQGASVTTCRT